MSGYVQNQPMLAGKILDFINSRTCVLLPFSISEVETRLTINVLRKLCIVVWLAAFSLS